MGPAKRSSRPSRSGAADDDTIELGYVSGVFGVRGEVRLFLHHRDSALLDAPRTVTLVRDDGEQVERRLTVRPGAGKRILGRIEGVADRDAAASWQGARIVVSIDSLPPLEEGEYYLWQLEGAAAEVDGQVVGRVTEVHQAGPVEVIEVRVGDDVHFVPSLRENVLEIDLVGNRIVLAAEALEETE